MGNRSLTSPDFWIDVAERAVRSFAHGTLVGFGVSATSIVPGVHLPWFDALLFGLIMAVISVLTSLASIPVPNADPLTGSFLPVNPGVALVSKFKRTA